MKKSIAFVIGVAVLTAATSAASAAEVEERFYLDPMIVTAERYDKTATKPGYYKADEQWLESGNYETALDVIKELPGVTFGSMGASGGFNGYSELLLNGSERYAVVVDGVKANWNGNMNNNFDFSVLPADMLSSIEILPASAGAVYGNDAKGGVIKITTKKATEGSKTNINLETGSYGLEKENLLHLAKKGDWSWSVYGQKSIMGDYSSARHKIPSYDNIENAAVKLTKAWGDKADLTLSYSAFSGRYSSTIFKTDKYDNKKIFMVDGRKTERNIAVDYNYKISDMASNKFGIYSRHSNAAYDDDPNVIDDKPWLINIKTEGFFDQYRNCWHKKHAFTGGIEYYQDKVLDYQDNAHVVNDRIIISKAVYLQDEWQLDTALKITGNLRQDFNSHAGNRLSPSAVLEYTPSTKMLYTLSYTEYFAPPKQVTLLSKKYGTEDLKPETGKIYEFGTAYKPDDSWIIKGNIFHRDAVNLIYVDNTVSPRRFGNVASEKTNGFTVSVSKRFDKFWRAFLSYSHVRVDTERNGKPLATGVPNGELRFNLLYDTDRYSTMLQGHGVFDQANGRGKNLYANNTYWVWDASVNYKLNKNAKLYFKVNNVFDQFYSTCDKGDPVLDFDEWYAEPGRNYQVGLNYTF